MAESLRRLVNIASFSILQEKLERWLDDYHVNSCDQNVARCCEIIELNAKVQGQIFKLLSLCASEGGMYGGAGAIKSRLLPWLGQSFFASGGSVTADTSLSVLAEAASKDREINELQDQYERSIVDLEDNLRVTNIENDNLRTDLAEAQDELDRTKRESTSEKMFNESEIRDLRNKLALAEDENRNLREKSGLLDDYERQLRILREEIAILTGERNSVLKHRSHVPLYQHTHSSTQSIVNGDMSDTYRSLPRVSSPLSPDDVTQRVRQQNLITRFNDMFAQDRLDAMDILRRYSDDHENNQRIVFAALVEAFASAKLAFRQFKLKVRSNLAATHVGPDTLEEAVQDYINRNTDLYDLPSLQADVVRALNRNIKIFLPADISYNIIGTFIREACKLAWQMSALAHPLDIAVSSDAELFDDYKYRRSYDSEYTAPLVNHHIWACLQQGTKVIVKGEACTRRGASLGSPRRSRSPTRSMSPTRSYSPSRARSRSPSPRRIGSPMDLNSSLSASFSGRSSPSGFRPSSRSSLRSSSPRPYTASTSLSNY
ncbi:mitochondria-eating protein isoform X1 [Lingula anatina]|uniref:Mitochondria-eating protein n=1 Tax=Lingula anatina TaxID=7574 RepID=A0A1S3K2R8_LINAN|nr:mitochondria-eating protein isoform X1 [Lingula anatina]|eukprot:XP_023931203.1 mitochondria-eating protein isoform X1 [Lingula anatina]